jgi:hypothetical protein
VVGLALSLAHVVSRRDRVGVGATPILLLPFFLALRRGPPPSPSLSIAFGPTVGEDHPDRLVAGGVVRGDVQELASGARLPAAKLVNDGLAGGPKEDCTDDICINDVREGIALLGEPVDVVPQGLTRLLFEALEVPGVFGAHVRPLEIPNEDLFELHLATDAVGRQEFEPCSNELPDTDGEVLDNEIIIVRSSGPTSEPKVFQPYTTVRLPSVLGDVGRWSEARREWCLLDAMTEGPQCTRALVAVPIARSAATPGVPPRAPVA